MKHRNSDKLFLRLNMKDGDGDGGGSSGPTVEELQEQLADVTSQFEAVKSKNDELLGETKKAKEERRVAEEEARKAAQEKAQKDGDFEQLFKSSQEQVSSLTEKLNGLQTSVAKEKRSNAALKIAGELAEGSNAELLATFVERRIGFKDGDVKVLNTTGELTVSSIDDLKKEFQADARYASLLKGNQSSGGGASGGSNSGGAADKTVSRAEFEKWAPDRKSKFFRDGGKLIE
jgi:predicted nuclease with TOPRIM domain